MKILVVDDSKVMRMHIMRAIRQAGFMEALFLEAENGKEALSFLHQELPDLLITDVNMPVMGGLELLMTVRSEGLKVKSGVISSQSTDEMKTKTQQAGALFLLSKPVTPHSIKLALDKVIQ